MARELVEIPEGAEYYLPLGEDKSVVTLFYRVTTVPFNDGVPRTCLEYYSSFNIWQGSDYSYPLSRREKFIKEALIKL